MDLVIAGEEVVVGLPIALDQGVYIRSMASRGSLGGLATTTREVCDLLDAADLFGLVVLALVVNATALLWAAGVAMRLRTMQAGPAMQVPVFLVLFLAPVYVPLVLLQSWIQAIARLNPATLLLETGRSFVAGDPVHVAFTFAVALALAAALAERARRGLASAERAG
jgi:ABC-2 type transport system permease protein